MKNYNTNLTTNFNLIRISLYQINSYIYIILLKRIGIRVEQGQTRHMPFIVFVSFVQR